MDGLSNVGRTFARDVALLPRHRMAQHSLGASSTHRGGPRGHDPRQRDTVQPESTPSQATDVSASWRRKDRSSLQIRTADGDVVNLRFKSVSTADLSSSTRTSDSGSSSELQLATSQRTRISMSVQGELDADELAAIQDTIGRAGEIASDFFGGDVQAAFDSAASFGITSDEIASVRMRMKTSERLTYAAQSVTSAPLATRTAPDLPPSPIAAILDPSGPGTTAPDAHAARGAEGAPQSEGAQRTAAEPGAEVETDVAPAPSVDDAPPLAPPDLAAAPARTATVSRLADFLDGLLTRVGAHEAKDTLSVGASFSRSISMSLKLRIVESVLVTAAEAERPAEPLPDIVTDVIDDLVAQEQPRMEAVA